MLIEAPGRFHLYINESKVRFFRQKLKKNKFFLIDNTMLSYLLYNEGENGVSGGKIMKKRFIIYTLIVSLLLQFIPSLNLLKAVEARNDLSNSSIVNSVTVSPSSK